METNDRLSNNDQELKQLDFSKPICWCESTGHYTNAQGQEFELRVRGTNTDVVEEYIKAARVSFEVLPSPGKLPENPEPSSQEYKEGQSRSEEELKSIELHPELDLEIAIEVVNAQGIKLPYVLNTVIDPPITGGATHNYVTTTNTKSIWD